MKEFHMKHKFLINPIFGCLSLLLLFALAAPAASPIRVIRAADTREPADQALTILYGETIDLRVRMLNYAAPVDLTGWTVMLHGQTNGQSEAESYQLAGLAGLPEDPAASALGWASVELPVSTWWPRDASAGRWSMVATSPDSSIHILRAGGPLTVRGSAAADVTASPPMIVAAALRTQWLADIAAATNGLSQGGGSSSGISPEALAAGIAAWAITGTVAVADFAVAAQSASSAEWTPEATHAVDADLAYALDPSSVDGASLSSSIAHQTNLSAHADIRQSIVGATNDLVKTYFLGTNAWMTISNATLSIWRTTNGIPTSLWSSAESSGDGGGSVDASFTNAIWSAIGSIEGQLTDKANKSWGQYAPDGSDNPDPAYMTFLNSPATMHASGYQWASYGAFSVLAQSGAVAFETGSSGEARWGLDLQTNYISFVRGGSVIVGARPGSISIAGEVAEIVYSYTAGDFPILWFSPALSVPFAVQEGVAWVDNTNGTATVSAPATTPKGFWYATSSASFDTIFEVHPPARMIGGVFGTTNALPVIYDSTIEVTSGGKTYRIPAQKVP